MEEDLVELLAQVVRRFPVGPGHVRAQGDGHADAVFRGLEVRGKDLLALGQSGQSNGDSILFGLEQLERDGAGVVGFHQLAALALQLLRFLLEGRLLGFIVGSVAPQLVQQ